MKNRILLTFCSIFLLNLALFAQNFLERANAAMGDQKWQEAAELFDKHLEKNQEDSGSWQLHGFCLIRAEKYADAVPSLEKAIELQYNPAFVAQFNLAKCQAALGQKKAALLSLEDSLNHGFSAPNRLKDKEFEILQEEPRFIALYEKAEKAAYPCLYDENARRFDFWLGEWDVYANGVKVGVNVITRTKGGCALHESYTTQGAYAGQSINFYDPISKKWKQSWVGSAGDVGNYVETDEQEGDLQFITKQLTANGIVLRKMTFYHNKEENTVRQLIEDSTDEGKTFTTSFDGLYKQK